MKLFPRSIGVWVGALAICMWAFAITPAHANVTTIGTEDYNNGFVGNLFDGVYPNSPYTVASDSEFYFDPFGAGYDTSDGLNFSNVGFPWYQASGSTWTSLGNQTWVLPADLTSIGCGTENSTTCEPVGHFWSPTVWNSNALGYWNILDPSGAISDQIYTVNANNGANLFFYSDPSVPAPEPSTLLLLATGLLGLGVVIRLRRRQTLAG